MPSALEFHLGFPFDLLASDHLARPDSTRRKGVGASGGWGRGPCRGASRRGGNLGNSGRDERQDRARAAAKRGAVKTGASASRRSESSAWVQIPAPTLRSWRPAGQGFQVPRPRGAQPSRERGGGRGCVHGSPSAGPHPDQQAHSGSIQSPVPHND